MNITITRKLSEDLNFLKNYLDEQSKVLRKAQVDAILKFERQYLNEAIAKLATNDETYTEDLSIPDTIIKAIAQKAGMDILTPVTTEVTGTIPKPEIDPAISDRELTVNPEPVEPATTDPEPEPVEPATTEPEPVVVPEPEVTEPEDDTRPDNFFGKVSGNGHKVEKKRDLTETEKDSLRAFFVSVDGQIGEDACVSLKNGMDEDVAIFQVTGFISYLHREVASGQITLGDIEGYIEWMKAKYPALLDRYNSAKFVALRQKATTYTA